jgi:hypothetical protein
MPVGFQEPSVGGGGGGVKVSLGLETMSLVVTSKHSKME